MSRTFSAHCRSPTFLGRSHQAVIEAAPLALHQKNRARLDWIFPQERNEATADTFNHLPSRFAQPEVTALCIEISFPPMVARASTM